MDNLDQSALKASIEAVADAEGDTSSPIANRRTAEAAIRAYLTALPKPGQTDELRGVFVRAMMSDCRDNPDDPARFGEPRTIKGLEAVARHVAAPLEARIAELEAQLLLTPPVRKESLPTDIDEMREKALISLNTEMNRVTDMIAREWRMHPTSALRASDCLLRKQAQEIIRLNTVLTERRSVGHFDEITGFEVGPK